MVTNLVVNARDAVEPGGEIAVRVDPRERDGGASLAITVTDNGCGIPEAVLDRIFEPYVTTKAKGSGLGLAIVKKIVEEHFGTIAFADRPGRGTIVTLSFDASLLKGLAEHDADQPEGDDRQIAALTRNR